MTAADEQNVAHEALPGPGQRLLAAREAQGRSFDDVVHELRLDPRVVAAIEADNLEGLGAPVFVKGYLRSYARLLGLPEQDIVAAWQPVEQDPEEFRTLSMQREVKTGASLSMFLLWALLALLALGALLYLLSGNGDDIVQDEATSEISGQTDPVAPMLREDFVIEEIPVAEIAADSGAIGVAEEGDVGDSADAREQAAGVAEPSAPDTVSVAAAAVEGTEPAQEAAPAGETELLVSFTAECWIELSAGGRRLLYGLEKPGRERRFSAKPPFRFFVGDADAVSIKLDGRDYVIPGSVRTGRNTARFVLNAEDIEGLR